jgi:multiple sugar transport system permease protein
MTPSQSKMLRNIGILAALIVLGLIMLVPLIWTVMLSLKSNGDLLRSTANAFHAPYTGENYSAILKNSQVLHWLMNSVIVSGLTTLGVLILSSLAGYGFARLDFPGRDKLFLFVLFGLAIPEQAVIITRHQLFSTLHLHNSFPGLILPGLAAPFGVFLMTQYFRAIPKELDEAAMLDNASKFRIFWKVLLPLTIPAQATLGIFTFLSSWNDYWWPLISATRADMFTLTVGLASSQINFAQTSGLGDLMTQAVFASVPILIVYIIFQKYIVKAVSGAAVR